MNILNLKYCINQISKLNENTLNEFEKICAEKPFFQIAQLLLLLNYKITNHNKFYSHLSKAAIYASDRQKFKNILDQIDTYSYNLNTNENIEIVIDKFHITFEDKDNKISKKEAIKELYKLLTYQVENKTIINNDNKIDNNFENKAEKDEENKSEQEILNENQKHLNLIDNFIKNEPKISRKKIEFYSPSDKSRESSEDTIEIVSETLAKICLEQGHKDKAIKIYNKLCLIYPEKSIYFANQIQKIEENN